MWITLDRENSGLPLSRQIYDKIRSMIFRGDLVSGQKLPSTRALSRELGVSRNTVLEVYNQMIAEGYLEAFHGSGTIVAEGLKSIVKLPEPVAYGNRKDEKKEDAGIAVDFCTGVPALKLFPQKEWARVYQNSCSSLPYTAYGYCSEPGVWNLREAIAKYLFRSRGISCDPENIIITSGSTQALSLISNLLKKDGEKVLIEEPTHPGLRNVISFAGCRVEPIPADNRGINTALLRPDRDVSYIYTTPSHQYPLGSILSIQRRLSLIRYAEDNNCYIAEDDYDSEFRYEGQPVSSLYELKPERVIYIGSFSKILSPAIRIGFMILPCNLVSSCRRLKTYSDVHTDALTQYTLADFICSGRLERHIWKMKKYYSRNRNHMLQELTEQFPEEFEILGHATGLHLVVRFHNIRFTEQLVREIAGHGVRVYPVEDYLLNKTGVHSREILLGYSSQTLSDITEGIRILKTVLHP